MAQQVVLKLYGAIETGFHVGLEIGVEGHAPAVEVSGWLPPPVEVMTHWQQWREAYRSLGAASRILQPKTVRAETTLSARKRDCQQSAHQLQRSLNDWLAVPSFRTIREKWFEAIAQGEPVRALIRTACPPIWHLPWHTWEVVVAYPQLELGFSSLDYESPGCSPRSRPQSLQILAILGNASGIDVQHDRQSLEQLPGAQTTFLVEPSRPELSDRLWQQPWDILFFAGHSRTEGNLGRLYFNQTESLTIAELRSSLQQSVQRGLQLAIFNSCDGLGLAQEFASLNLPQMIVMREPIPDRVAQIFLNNFLDVFSSGASLYQSFQQARQRLEGLEGDYPCASWLPLIWQNPAAIPLSWPSLPSLPDPPFTAFRKKVLKTGIGVGVLAASVTIALRLVGTFQPVELWAWDQIMQLQPNEPPDSRLLIVQVREEDLRTYQNPIHDRALTQLLNKLSAARPAVIGLDILRDLPQPPGTKEFLRQLQHSDRLIGICKHSTLSEAGTPPPPHITENQTGFNDIILDPGDVIRRNLLMMTPQSRSACRTTRSFSLRVASAYLKTQQIPTGNTPDEYLKIGSVTFQPLDLPTGGYQRDNFVDLSGHQILLRYRRSQGSFHSIAQQVSLADVLNNRVDPSAIRDRIVLIGVTASSIKDDFNTPSSEKLRGLMIHAQMVSQVVSAVLDGRSLLWVWNPWIDGVWIGGWAVVGSVVVGRGRSQTAVLQRSSGLLGSIFLSCYGASVMGGWIPLVPAAISLVLGSAGQFAVLSWQAHTVGRSNRP